MCSRGWPPAVWLAVAAAAFASLGPAPARADRPDEDRARTEVLVQAWAKTDRWPLRALALLSLGERWHPAGAGMALEALAGKDPRLQAFALEALIATRPADLRRVLVPDLVGALVAWQTREKNDRVRLNLEVVLRRAFPAARVGDGADWARWWRDVAATYAPPPWEERPVPEPPPGQASRTVAAPAALQRAFDLSQGGMQVVLVLDTTGSMQPTIEAVKAGLRDVVAVLAGIADPFQIGLVHYRDLGDLGGSKDALAGAQTLVRLTPRLEQVRERLDGLVAGGGGDFPERVDAGLRHALDRTMGWDADANKMVLLVGDAPPHSVEDAEAVAREAFRGLPGSGGPPRRVATPSGSSARSRPLVVSALAVGLGEPSPDTREAFERISRAGGGFCLPFRTDGDPRETGAQVVRRVIEIAFGERTGAQALRLVDVWMLYRSIGFLSE